MTALQLSQLSIQAQQMLDLAVVDATRNFMSIAMRNDPANKLKPAGAQPQWILAVDTEALLEHAHLKEGLSNYPLYQFLADIQPHACLRERTTIEDNPRYRQLLPYVIIRQVGADGVLRPVAYKRTDAGGEAKLFGKASCGFGGHIDAADVVWQGRHNHPTDRDHQDRQSIPNLLETLTRSAMREVGHEEVKFTDSEGEPWFPTLLISNEFILANTPVELVHMAVIFYVDVPASVKVECKPPLPGMPVEHETLASMTPSDILEQGWDLERWSKLYLENVVREATNLRRLETSMGLNDKPKDCVYRDRMIQQSMGLIQRIGPTSAYRDWTGMTEESLRNLANDLTPDYVDSDIGRLRLLGLPGVLLDCLKGYTLDREAPTTLVVEEDDKDVVLAEQLPLNVRMRMGRAYADKAMERAVERQTTAELPRGSEEPAPVDQAQQNT